MIKSMAFSLLLLFGSCALPGMEQENKLASVLEFKLNEIKFLKAGEKLEIPNQSIKMLNPGIYILKNDSKLNEYMLISFKMELDGIRPVSTSKIVHQIELYKIPKIKSGSIFKSCCLMKTTGYDLNIIYNNDTEASSDQLEFKENNSYIDCQPNPGFTQHAERIDKYTKINTQTASLKNLLILKRK